MPLDIGNAYSKYLNNESEVKLENIIMLLIKSIEKNKFKARNKTDF